MKASIYSCPNTRCRDYGKAGLGNVVVCDRYGKTRRRLLRCKTCNYRFSERRWNIFFGLHTDDGIIRQTVRSLFKGNSIRMTAKEVGLDKDTVQRIWKRVIDNWEMTITGFIEDINLRGMDINDCVSFMGRKKRQEV